LPLNPPVSSNPCWLCLKHLKASGIPFRLQNPRQCDPYLIPPFNITYKIHPPGIRDPIGFF
jgi:hypothetical protein